MVMVSEGVTVVVMVMVSEGVRVVVIVRVMTIVVAMVSEGE